MATFYEPDHDPNTKAAVLEEFARALNTIPAWAVSRGFDSWVANMNRRPSPAEIKMRAIKEVTRLREELETRRPKESPQVRAEPSDEQKQRIKALVKSYRDSVAEKLNIAPKEPKPHWSKTAAPDDPRWEDLKRARAEQAIGG